MIAFAYAMTNEAVAVGLVQAGFVSVGAATTISVIGLGAIVSRRLGLKLFDPSRPPCESSCGRPRSAARSSALVLSLAMLAVTLPRRA